MALYRDDEGNLHAYDITRPALIIVMTIITLDIIRRMIF
jgi:hypothetical protein